MTILRELANNVFVGDFNDKRIICNGGNERVRVPPTFL
jgi:hypothetical protein